MELPTPEVRRYQKTDGDYLYVRNLYETRRMQYTLMNLAGTNPETSSGGKLLYGKKGTPYVRISLTIPDNAPAWSFWPCRDSKLFDETLLRENMERYFEMGGREYLEERQYYDPEVTVTDVIYAIGSILDALAVGDNDRFHLEAVRHSEEEIEKLLAMGHKLEHVQPRTNPKQS